MPRAAAHGAHSYRFCAAAPVFWQDGFVVQSLHKGGGEPESVARFNSKQFRFRAETTARRPNLRSPKVSFSG
jgi:hypothetical protein